MPLKTLLTTCAALYACLMTELIAADTLTVVITNVPESKGTIMLQVMAGEGEFSGEASPVAAFRQRARSGELTFSTSGLPSGDYAVRVMHDRNDNGELDSNFVGMPSEPWAFSNNATGSFGPPGWEQVKFTHEGDSVQRIRLNH